MAYADGVAQLWFNEQWTEEFANFIKTVVSGNSPPLLIEIHPPYKDYCASMEQFFEYYRAFAARISSFYPGTKILIENRFGTGYKRSHFLISSCQDIVDLGRHLNKTGSGLGIVIDLPQLLDQTGIPRLTIVQLKEIFTALRPCTRIIKGIHLWGPRSSGNSSMRGVHDGDLDSLFGGNKAMKQGFLEGLYELLNDDVARYFVPEVSNDDQVASIVNDLISVGFKFGGRT